MGKMDSRFLDILKDNMIATTDPGVTDDSDSGYAVGSLWANTSTSKVFRCKNSGVGVAVWTLIQSANLLRYSDGISDDTLQSLTIAKLTGSQVVTGSGEILEYDSILTDQQSEFNISTFRWTATRAGIYKVDANVVIGWVDGTSHSIHLRKNGAGDFIGGKTLGISTRYSPGLVYTGALSLASSDYLEMYIDISGSSGGDTVDPSLGCYFIIKKIG